jgi:hypothetical protein
MVTKSPLAPQSLKDKIYRRTATGKDGYYLFPTVSKGFYSPQLDARTTMAAETHLLRPTVDQSGGEETAVVGTYSCAFE